MCSQLFWTRGGLSVHRTRSASCRELEADTDAPGTVTSSPANQASSSAVSRPVRARPLRVPVEEAESELEESVADNEQPQPPADNDVNVQAEVTPTFSNLPAVYKFPPSLVPPFAKLFAKVAGLLCASVEEGRADQVLHSLLLALPVLVHRVSGQREIRRRKRLLYHLAALEEPVDATVQEIARIKLAMDEQRPELAGSPRRPTKRIIEFLEAGCAGKAVRRLEGHLKGGVVQYTEELQGQVRELYPEGPDGLPGIEGEAQTLSITAAELVETAQAAPRMSAAGISGWTYDLIKVVVSDEQAAAETAAKFLTLMANGRLGHQQLWLRSRMVLLSKPNGGIRPLSVGEAWVRMLGRALAKRYAAQASAHLAPLQFGIGVQGGVEICAHVLQTAADAVRDGSVVVRQIDCANAFNTVSRLTVAREIDAHLPALSCLLRWSYGSATPLLSSDGEEIAKTSSGVRQGDPLGPLFFAYAMQPVLRELSTMFADIDIVAYLDDVHLVGPPDRVQEAYDVFITRVTHVGLRVNPHKSHLLDEEAEGMVVLGTPVGKETFVGATMEDLFMEKAAVLPELLGFEAKYCLAMIRASISERPMYWARTLPPGTAHAAFKQFDEKIDDTLAQMCGGSLANLNDTGKHIRHLPLSMGGLGLRRLEAVREKCWAASFAVAVPHLQQHVRSLRGQIVEDKVNTLRQHVPTVAPQEEGDARPCAPVRQRDLLKQVDTYTLGLALESVRDSPALQAWVTSNACSESSVWLLAAGSGTCRYPVSDRLVRTALQLKLLQPASVGEAGDGFACVCDARCSTAAELMVHAIACTQLSELRVMRHNKLRDLLTSCLRGVGHGARVDAEVVLPRPGDRRTATRLRSDVRFTNGGELVHFDIAVVSPAAQHALASGSASQAGVAAAAAEQLKRNQYAVALASAGLSAAALRPVVFEATARRGQALVEMEAWLASRLALSRDDEATAEGAAARVRGFFTSCSACIWQHNSMMIEAVLVNRSPIVRA